MADKTYLLLALSLLLMAGCGHHHHDYDGDIVVDNRTDLTTNEELLTFRVAGFQDPFTGDLFNGTPLVVGGARHMGTWDEDYYDGQGDLELGQVIEWFDEFVGDGRTTYFEVR